MEKYVFIRMWMGMTLLMGTSSKLFGLISWDKADANRLNIQTSQKDKASEMLSMSLEITQSIMITTEKAKALTKISVLYAQAGQKNTADEILSQAEEVADEIQNTEEKAKVLAEVAVKYADAGENEKATGCFSRAIESTQSINDDLRKIQTRTDVALKCATAGQQQKASEIMSVTLEIAEKIGVAQEKMSALGGIAKKYVDIGQKDKAAEILPQPLKIAREITDTAVRARALVWVANKYIAAEQNEEAAEILSQALKLTNKIKDARGKATILADISSQYLAAEQYDQAFEVAKTIEYVDWLTNALARIASKHVEFGQKEKVTDILAMVLESVKDTKLPQIKDRELSMVAKAYAESGQCEAGLQVAEQINDAGLKATALSTIAAGYAKIRQKDKALELFVRALEMSKGISELSKARNLDMILKDYVEAKQTIK
ncbi:MAG: hypothetical protein AMJ79_12090 [Phycisphaerae bacterium SM23_30]|nr:MAG: hypothetical protein AMJ79_12090 [Phycisphaerae bacterium SM23_30]